MRKLSKKKKIIAFVLFLIVLAVPVFIVYGSSATGSKSGTNYYQYSPYTASNPDTNTTNGWGISQSSILGVDASSNAANPYYANELKDIGNYSTYATTNNAVRSLGGGVNFAFEWLPQTGKVDFSRMTYMKIYQVPTGQNITITYGAGNENLMLFYTLFDKDYNYIKDTKWFAVDEKYTISSSLGVKYIVVTFKINDGMTGDGTGTQTITASDIYGSSYDTWLVFHPYTVVLNKSGGTGGTSQIYCRTGTAAYLNGDFNGAMTTTGYAVTIPTRSGYDFAGYYTAATGGSQIINANGYITSDRAAYDYAAYLNSTSATLYAQWKSNTYTVAYNGNGSTSGTMANDIHTYGQAYNLSQNKFSKTGYTFCGWSTSSLATTPTYTDQQSVKNITAAGGSITLFAVWKINTYTVKFLDDDNTTVLKTTSYNYGSTVTVPLNPEKPIDGTYMYAFTGWSPAVNTICTGNATYTAVYTKTELKYSDYITANTQLLSSSNDMVLINPDKPIFVMRELGSKMLVFNITVSDIVKFTSIDLDYGLGQVTINYASGTVKDKAWHYAFTVPEDKIIYDDKTHTSVMTFKRNSSIFFTLFSKYELISYEVWSDDIKSCIEYQNGMLNEEGR